MGMGPMCRGFAYSEAAFPFLFFAEVAELFSRTAETNHQWNSWRRMVRCQWRLKKGLGPPFPVGSMGSRETPGLAGHCLGRIQAAEEGERELLGEFGESFSVRM
jgi:hypothetical protein